MKSTLTAGAAAAEITPESSQFLQGYPHVERYSEGVHDPLLSSALYLSNGRTSVLFVANDIVFVPKAVVKRVRERIAAAIPVPAVNVMVTATHTHSGPIMLRGLFATDDPAVPNPDPEYIQFMEDRIVSSAREAYGNAEPAELGLAVADGTGVGSNRREPSGPSDPQVPVLMVRSVDGRRHLACMIVCSMHPTVLHEDSRLVSADFPGMTRVFLQHNHVGKDCPVLHHTGPAGNQSPRHVTRSNTFPEAERLGGILGKAVAKVMPAIEYRTSVSLNAVQVAFDPPVKKFTSVAQAKTKLARAINRLKHLQTGGAPSQEVRTAECDWFGAEEGVTLARSAVDGRLENAVASFTPLEIQVIRVGPWRFAGWQGEVFVEYALQEKERSRNTFVISLANGESQGYIVTPEAAKEGGYEASNGLLSYETGQILVDKTLETLNKLNGPDLGRPTGL